MVVPVRQQGAAVSTKIVNKEIYPTEWKALRRNDLNARTERFTKSENNLPINEFLKLARSKLEQSGDTTHSSDGSSSSSSREAFDTENLEKTLHANEEPDDTHDNSAGSPSSSNRKAFDTDDLEEALPHNETPVTSSSIRLNSISSIGSVHMSSNREAFETENLEETLHEQPDDTHDSSGGSSSSSNRKDFDTDDLEETLPQNETPVTSSSSRSISISTIGSVHMSSNREAFKTENLEETLHEQPDDTDDNSAGSPSSSNRKAFDTDDLDEARPQNETPLTSSSNRLSSISTIGSVHMSSNREAFETENLEETLHEQPDDTHDSNAGSLSSSNRKAFDTDDLDEALPQNETPVTSSSNRLSSISTIGSVHMSSNREAFETENLEETLHEQPDDTDDNSAGSPSSSNRKAFDTDDLEEALPHNETPLTSSSNRLSSRSTIGSDHMSSESDTVISPSSSNREAFDTDDLEETLHASEQPDDTHDSSAGSLSSSNRKAFDTDDLDEALPQNETPVTSSSSRLSSISTIGSVHMSSNREAFETENLEETLHANEQPDDTPDSSAGSPSSSNRKASDIDDLEEVLPQNETPLTLSTSRLSNISSIGSAHFSSESGTGITESTISDNSTESSYDTLTSDSVSIQQEDCGLLREIHVGVGPNTTCADLELVKKELGYLVTNEICRIRESRGHKPAIYIISFHDL